MSGFRRSAHKYNVGAASKRTADGIVFDSQWECKTYLLLKGLVPKEHLQLQTAFLLQEGFRSPTGKKIREIKYVCDFILGEDTLDDTGVFHLADNHIVVDCKGMITPEFKLKEKLFMFKYGHLIHKPKTNNMSSVVDLVDMYKKTWQ